MLLEMMNIWRVVYSQLNNHHLAWGPRAQFSGSFGTRPAGVKPDRRRKPRSRFIHNWWTRISIILAWVYREFFELSEYQPLLSSVINRFLRSLKTVLHCRGFRGAIALVKERRQMFYTFLSAPLEQQEAMKRGRFGRFWGCELLSEVQKFRGDNPEGVRLLRMVMTVLSVTRAATLPTKFDLAPIANRFRATEVKAYAVFLKELDKFGTYCDRFWPSVGVAEGTFADDPSYKGSNDGSWFSRSHWSFKAGPSGPATLTALADLRALRSRPIYENVKSLGGPLLRERMELLEQFLDGPLSSASLILTKGTSKGFEERKVELCSSAQPRLRVLRAIPDKEGKTRLMAIGDYWSQAALYPIHQVLFRVLKKIPQDMTFNQNAFISRLTREGAFRPGITFHSIDLSSATDRWPFALMVEMMRVVLGPDRVQDWQLVMTALPFEVDPSKGNVAEVSIRYEVGNPMGFYTSWAAFAMSHHAVIRMLGERVCPGVKPGKLEYVVLGDDVLIWNDALAAAYKDFLAVMGVDWSPAKTYVSSEMFEFAKRIFFRGTEITPFPVSAVMGALKNPVLLGAVLISESRKGFVPRSGISVAVKRLKHRLDPLTPASVVRKWGRAAFEAETIFYHMTKKCSADDAVQAILKRNPVLVGKPYLFEEGVGALLLREAAAEVFCSSLERTSGRSPGGSNSVSEMANQFYSQICGPLMAKFQDLEKNPGSGGIPSCGPFGVIRAIPFFDSLRGVGDSVSRVLTELPNEEFLASDAWLEMVRVMTFRDDLAWGFASNQVQRVAAGVLLSRALIALAQHPDLLDPRFRAISRRGYVERLPKNWMYTPESPMLQGDEWNEFS